MGKSKKQSKQKTCSKYKLQCPVIRQKKSTECCRWWRYDLCTLPVSSRFGLLLGCVLLGFFPLKTFQVYGWCSVYMLTTEHWENWHPPLWLLILFILFPSLCICWNDPQGPALTLVEHIGVWLGWFTLFIYFGKFCNFSVYGHIYLFTHNFLCLIITFTSVIYIILFILSHLWRIQFDHS